MSHAEASMSQHFSLSFSLQLIPLLPHSLPPSLPPSPPLLQCPLNFSGCPPSVTLTCAVQFHCVVLALSLHRVLARINWESTWSLLWKEELQTWSVFALCTLVLWNAVQCCSYGCCVVWRMLLCTDNHLSFSLHLHPTVAKDGRLAAGDQLLSVDGRSLVGLSQERYD